MWHYYAVSENRKVKIKHLKTHYFSNTTRTHPTLSKNYDIPSVSHITHRIEKELEIKPRLATYCCIQSMVPLLQFRSFTHIILCALCKDDVKLKS